MKGFSNEEIKRLIYLADKSKKEGKSLCGAFGQFAQESGRAKGSVRNYYYSLLSGAEKGDKKCAEYLKGTNLRSEKFDKFTRKSEETLLENIFLRVGKGISVRRAIIEIADGDEKKILRYQNKYRNLIIKNRPLVESVVERLKDRGINLTSPYKRAINDDLLIGRLKSEINALVGRISESVREENQRLKKRIQMLEKENASLLLMTDKVSPSKAIGFYEKDQKIL